MPTPSVGRQNGTYLCRCMFSLVRRDRARRRWPARTRCSLSSLLRAGSEPTSTSVRSYGSGASSCVPAHGPEQSVDAVPAHSDRVDAVNAIRRPNIAVITERRIVLHSARLNELASTKSLW
jgi:hypothetical protein